MPHADASPRHRWFPVRREAWHVALAYAVIGVLWILVSDWVLSLLVPDRATAVLVQQFKGWVFVLTTAALLAVSLDRYLGQVIRTEAARRQWADAFEHCVHGIALGRSDTNEVLACNPAFARLVDRGVGEIAGSPIVSLYAPEDAEVVRASIAGADCEGQVRYEARMVRRDGSLVPVQMDVVSVRDAGGAVVYRVATAQDITERRRADEALRESEARYRLVSENTSDVIWLYDLGADRFTYVARSVERLRGFTVEETLTQRMEHSLTPDSYRLVAGGLRARLVAFEAGDDSVRTQTDEVDQVRKDGTTVPTEVVTTLVADPRRHVTHIQGVSRDITRRKRADEALQRSEAEFRAMFEMASIGIAQADPETGRWLRVNPKMCAITGYSAAEMLQLRIWDITHPADVDPDREGFQRVVRGEASDYRFEKRYIRKDGTVAWVNVNMTTLRDSDERPLRTMATIEDITERRRLEAELRQAQKLEAIGQLAGGVAHDFNNILAAIMMHVGLMQMTPGLDPETLEAVADIEAQARRAASLTRQLLMFSRRSVLSVRPLDLGGVVTDLLKMLTRLIGEQIDIRYEGKSALPLVKADSGMLEQVLMNLVVNARDAMPKGGRITISTSVLCLDAESAGHPDRRPGRFVCLTVADTGCGMDGATLKRIFEPFFTTKEAGHGTGLGLATVHGIVAQHQGWVEVDSAVGRGSAFRVMLPAIDEAPEVEEAGAPAAVPTGRETILLVEDEPFVRGVAARALRALGYTVREAENGVAAMKVWQAHHDRIDLVLTDMVMPEGITGLELAQELRALKPGLKVIISSGYSAEIVQAGSPAGAGIVYFPKPYEARKLAAAVRQCLDQG